MPASRTKPISANAFAGQAAPPTERELASVLGNARALWLDVVSCLKRDLKLDSEEWNTYSVKAGWSLRMQKKKRNIVYLGPRTGWFLASFVLGEKAVSAARKGDFPRSILKMIGEAKRYAEGTAVRIEVHTAKDANVVRALAKIKVEN